MPLPTLAISAATAFIFEKELSEVQRMSDNKILAKFIYFNMEKEISEMTTEEVMKMLCSEPDVYEKVEQDLRRLILKEKPEAILPLLSRDIEELTASGSSQYMPSCVEEFMKTGTHMNDKQEETEGSEVDEVAG